MTIAALRITDFRNLATVDLAPNVAGMNVFCGNNGSGKTSLLEAIHYLSMGKSFRSSNASRLIRHETEKFSLFVQVSSIVAQASVPSSAPSFRGLTAEFMLAPLAAVAAMDSAVKPRNDGGEAWLRNDTTDAANTPNDTTNAVLSMTNTTNGTTNPVLSTTNSTTSTITTIGMERTTSGATRLRMNEQDLSGMAEIATFLPVRIINSQSHLLVESGPVYRRKYLDWGLFYHSERFLSCWRQFERVLKQRNAVLKNRRSKQELDGWTEALVTHGVEFDALRQDYIRALEPILAEVLHELLNLSNIELIYNRGWDENSDYTEVLANSYLDDYRYGYTQAGPHRADFEIYSDGLPVKHFLSRGQQKLLICAMIIAQGVLLARHRNKGLIYLVDDLPSELDLHSRQKLIALLSRQPAQIFITAIEKDDVCCLVGDEPTVPMKVFHVEHGTVRASEY